MPRSKYTQGKDGRWRTAIRTGEYDDQGKPIMIRLSSTKSSADLEKQVREYKYKLERGHVYVNQNITLAEYALTWLDTKKSRSQVTYQEYEYFVNNHLKAIETMRVDYIRPTDIQRLINSYADHPRMCEKILLTLHQIFDMAINEDLIVKNPCNKIELPRHVKKEKRILTESECKIVKDAEGLEARERALIHLFYGSGLRPAEIYALTWRDIDLENHTVSVNKALQFSRTGQVSVGLPKTDKSIRTIPLPDFVIESIQIYKNDVNHGKALYLFGAEGYLFKSRTGYDKLFNRTVAALGLKGITAYSFRHNFCTMCYRNKIDVKTCQYLMGHADTKMVLEVYTHLDKQNNVIAAAVNSIKF